MLASWRRRAWPPGEAGHETIEGPSTATRLAAAAAVFLLLFALPAAALLWATSVPGRSHAGALPPPTARRLALAERLRKHVTGIASRPHNVAHPEALEEAARHIERSLSSSGYRLNRQVFQASGVEVRNIEAVIEPASATAATLVIGAHYDSWLTAPGANDDGSGTAAVLELARLLADLRGRSRLRIRLVLFVNEEPPFFKTDKMGSLVYARRLARSGERVDGMLSLETLGFYTSRERSQSYPPPLGLLYPPRGDFVAFVGLTSARPLVRRAVGDFRDKAAFPSVGGTAPGFLSGIDWSDHWSFAQVGIPAAMVTDTAPFRYPHYHSDRDTPDKVDYDSLARVVTGLEAIVRQWAAAGRIAPR